MSLYLLILFIQVSCAFEKAPYDLYNADKTIVLHEELNEISGLTLTDDSRLLCVQDEKAVVYTLNKNNGEIRDKYDFGKDADFEGIAYANNKIYVLKSNGDIKRIKKDDKVKTYNQDHNKGEDFEGLCHDQNNNRLLVACKEHANKEKNDDIRIYAFDLKEKKYLKKPAYKISKKKIAKDFNPSGIAIHPDGNIYIISSTSKKLLVLSAGGDIIAIEKLPKYIFNQPEGITFDQSGNLFISNEKKNTQPTLLKFELKI